MVVKLGTWWSGVRPLGRSLGAVPCYRVHVHDPGDLEYSNRRPGDGSSRVAHRQGIQLTGSGFRSAETGGDESSAIFNTGGLRFRSDGNGPGVHFCSRCIPRGVADAIPTRQVLAGFAPVTPDNRQIIKQEWLAEAFTMWVAVIVIVATAVGGTSAEVTLWVYRVTAGLLIALAVLTNVTGARTQVVWFKICPVLLTGSAVLLFYSELVVANILSSPGRRAGEDP